jgi:hypothetical protein
MAFTRDNIGQTTSFTRSGATTFQSTPNFQIFNVTDTTSNFSLNNKWTISTIGGTSASLTFKYNNTTMLELTENGVGSLVMPALKLNNLGGLPNFAGYAIGDIVKTGGELYVLIDNENPTP